MTLYVAETEACEFVTDTHVVNDQDRYPVYCEVDSLEHLSESTAVLERLRSLDWAFTEDDTSFLSHGLHPYPAKFIPQLPGQLIANLSIRGETVLDPFGGSGTTAVEAIRLGRSAVSVDASQLAALIGRAKTTRLNPDIEEQLALLKGMIEGEASLLPVDPKSLVARFQDEIPPIPNIEQWFPTTACGELACIKAGLRSLDSDEARDVASLAFSRIVLRVSYQDSETRYKRTLRDISQGTTFRLFLRELERTLDQLRAIDVNPGEVSCRFITADSRDLVKYVSDDSVDVIVTSPPYGNATDYHLYLRFRMFWLGFDPREFARVEIGSHLRHQRENSGFESYADDLLASLSGMARVLKPERYAALVLGDSVYSGERYETAEIIGKRAQSCGFDFVGIVRRPIHTTKRSFVAAARRADEESVLLLRKRSRVERVRLVPPGYRLWSYEQQLRLREVATLFGSSTGDATGLLEISADLSALDRIHRLAFSHSMQTAAGVVQKTWQGILENGHSPANPGRKESKYVSHGLHPYKGKFYPQLAKSLLNVSGLATGGVVLDPFCGSGTTVLESKLNGFAAYGCDMHPLAASLARTKSSIIDTDLKVFFDRVAEFRGHLVQAVRTEGGGTDQFSETALPEIYQWFAPTVIGKINFLLRTIREWFCGTEREYCELLVSSIVREVSHQDPADLRIRRRKVPLMDADVTGLFLARLDAEVQKLVVFSTNRELAPFRRCASRVIAGDARDRQTYTALGLTAASVDLVLTSPPYATALPYIDTDRLSLLILYGMTSADRRPVEQELTGSREISLGDRRALDNAIANGHTGQLPQVVQAYIECLYEATREEDVGFRRKNLPALLLRFFRDMAAVFENCHRLLRPEGEAIVVIGDNYTTVGGERILIPTTRLLVEIAEIVGFNCIEQIPIDVTVENLKHIRHAITKNTVLRLRLA